MNAPRATTKISSPPYAEPKRFTDPAAAVAELQRLYT